MPLNNAPKQEMLFDFIMWGFLAGMSGAVFCIFAVLIIHFLLLPKKILEKYFKEPHFRKTELVLFGSFPLAYMRTVMFMGVLAFPKQGKLRKLENVYLLAPTWLRILSTVVVIGVLITMALIVATVIAFAFFYGL